MSVKGTKIVRVVSAAALFITAATAVCAAPQSVATPAYARSDSPWNVLVYGGKGETHGAPACHPLAYFSQLPLSLDFEGDFIGEKTADLTTQAKVTLLGTMTGRRVYEVRLTVHLTDAPGGTQPSYPPTMKILLVERRIGEFCAIYENQYAYDATHETDEAVILTINGRKVLKTYETDARTWFLVYWVMGDDGPLRLKKTDALYSAIGSVSPDGSPP